MGFCPYTKFHIIYMLFVFQSQKSIVLDRKGECSLPMEPVVKGARPRRSTSILYSENEEGENVIKKEVGKLHEMMVNLNPYYPPHRVLIAAHYGIQGDYNNFLKKYRDDNEYVNSHISLVRAMAKMRKRTKKSEKFVNLSMSMMEGNNRIMALVHGGLCALYDPNTGKIEPCSMTKEWLIHQVGERRCRDFGAIKKQFDAEPLPLKGVLERVLRDKNSMYNTSAKMWVYVGCDYKRFKDIGLSMSDVQDLCKERSERISNDKKSSVIPPGSMAVGTALDLFLAELEANVKLDKIYNDKGYPSHSKWSSSYVENTRLGRGAKKESVVLGRPCPLITEREGMALLKNPCKETFKAFLDATKVGLVTKRGKVWTTVGGEARLPMFYTAKGLFGMTGMIDSREASDKYDTWLSLDQPKSGVWDTYKGIPVNCPVGLEERSKMMLICLTFPSIFRMFKGIPHATWETSLHKTACEKECKFLLRRYCCTDESAAATLTLDPDDKYNEDVLDFMDSTPFDQERRHWACTLLIVDTMVSLTCKESGTKVDLTRVTEFVDMIANCHKDMKDYTDKSMVNVLGKEMNDFYHIGVLRSQHVHFFNPRFVVVSFPPVV